MYEYSNVTEQSFNVIGDHFREIDSEPLVPGDTPMFFGHSAELYGVCRVPEKTTHQSAGVLLCYGIGEEYLKKHRFFKELSDILIHRGMPVFKFDYLGTGDSRGDCRDWDMNVWSENILTAAGEFKKRTKIETLHIVAFAVGALLATAAMKKGLAVEKLILWDPVISGSRYLNHLKNEHEKRIEVQKKLFPFPKESDLLLQDFEIKGFHYKPEFQEALAAATLNDFDLKTHAKVKIIRSKNVKGFQLAFPVVQEKRRLLKTISTSILGDM